MTLLTAMSVAGSIPLIVHYLLKALLRERYGVRWRSAMLHLSLFFYLCPFQKLKYILPGKGPDFLYWRKEGERFYLSLPNHTIIKGALEGYVIKPIWLILVETVWLTAVAGFVLYQAYRYFRLKRELWKTSELLSSSIPYTFGNAKREKRKKISCMRNARIRTPFTAGVWRTCIVLPELCVDEELERMIYLHEYTHIRNHDILKKFLCMGAALLHWFNPISWLLLYEYGVISELVCDERVVQSLQTQEERKQYARLLVELAVKETKIPMVFSNHLSRGGRSMKRRVERILGETCRSAKVVPFIVAAMLFLCTATAIAYEAEASTTKENLKIAKEETFALMEYETPQVPQGVDFSQSDMWFVEDATGNCVPVYQQSDAETNLGCSHVYTVGKVWIHSNNDGGGCTVSEYSAYKCTKCGYFVPQKLLVQYVYPECTH